MYRFLFPELTFRQFIELVVGDLNPLSNIKKSSNLVVKRVLRHIRLLPMMDRKRGDVEAEL